jgi:hypothetical protein
MAVVQADVRTFHVGSPPIPDGRYVIKSRAANIFWSAVSPIKTVYFYTTAMVWAKDASNMQVNEHSLVIKVFKR